MAIYVSRKSIAIFALWTTQLEISPKPHHHDQKSLPTQRRFLQLWPQIYLVQPFAGQDFFWMCSSAPLTLVVVG